MKEFALALPKIGMQFLRRSGHRQLSIPDLPLDTNVSRGFSLWVISYEFSKSTASYRFLFGRLCLSVTSLLKSIE
ncbi:hypothetical protein ACTXNE_06230 [Psychrobacter namhaensis]|uniref:hypothetical protein n=1 Tax=Psychrobacter namhaensis TaxID=292734 RepID=UPI003FD1E239